MSIRDWPEAERPREKLLEQGAAALSDAELLAIFLRTGVTGCSAVELSRRLLSEFGGLRALLEADLASFCGHLGLGVAKYAQLQAVLEMGRRHLAERLRRDSILESPQAVRDYLKARLRHEQHEVFACLFLDTRHRVLAFEVLFQGSIDGASVYPRQVVKRTLAHNAAALILTHNHPPATPVRVSPTASSLRASRKPWRSSTCGCSTTSSSATASRCRWPNTVGCERSTKGSAQAPLDARQQAPADQPADRADRQPVGVKRRRLARSGQNTRVSVCSRVPLALGVQRKHSTSLATPGWS